MATKEQVIAKISLLAAKKKSGVKKISICLNQTADVKENG